MKLLPVIAIFVGVMFAEVTVKGANINARIVGGNKDDISNHKHLVALMYNNGVMCGGSLVSTSHVVTAAHCLKNNPNSPSSYSIRAGSTNKKSGGQTRQVKTIWMHPNYKKEEIDYDIAVLKLSQTVSGTLIKPIALPTSPLTPGDIVTVAGWGTTDTKGTVYPDVMHSVTMTLVDRQSCIVGGPRMLCSLNSGKGFCFGDSGGPLTKDGVLYGVISFNGGCGSDYFPSVSADVLSMKSFIDSKLNL